MKLRGLGILLVAMISLPTDWALAMPRQDVPASQNSPAALPSQPSTSSQTSPANAPPPMVPAGKRSPTWAPLQFVDVWNSGTLDPIWFHNEVLARVTLFTSHENLTPFDIKKFHDVVTAWRTAAPDLHFDVKDTIVSADGNKVVLRLLGHGTFIKPLFGPMWGNQPHKVFFSETLIFQLQDGKISQIWQDDDDSRIHLLMGQHWCVNGTGGPPAQPSPSTAVPGPAPQAPYPQTAPSSAVPPGGAETPN